MKAVPAEKLGETVAASVIVMLGAALPVSFGGWGLRELSASLAFSHIGFTPEQGFAVAMVVGLLSMAALIGNTACAGLWPYSVESRADCIVPPRARPASLEHSVYWLFALGTTVAVLFQVHIPTHSGELNVNLGDPIAMMGGLVVLGLAWQSRALAP